MHEHNHTRTQRHDVLVNLAHVQDVIRQRGQDVHRVRISEWLEQRQGQGRARGIGQRVGRQRVGRRRVRWQRIGKGRLGRGERSDFPQFIRMQDGNTLLWRFGE